MEKDTHPLGEAIDRYFLTKRVATTIPPYQTPRVEKERIFKEAQEAGEKLNVLLEKVIDEAAEELKDTPHQDRLTFLKKLRDELESGAGRNASGIGIHDLLDFSDRLTLKVIDLFESR